MQINNTTTDSVNLGSIDRANKNAKAKSKDSSGIDKLDISKNHSSARNVQLSSEAKLLAKGIEVSKSSDLSDQQKIDRVKQLIQQGKYNPSAAEIAGKIVDEEMAMSELV